MNNKQTNKKVKQVTVDDVNKEAGTSTMKK